MAVTSGFILEPARATTARTTTQTATTISGAIGIRTRLLTATTIGGATGIRTGAATMIDGALAPLLVERAEEVLPVDRAVAGLGVEGRALQRCCHLPKSAILRTSDHPQSSDSFRYKMATDRTLTTGEKFERLVGIMARLRAPGGCPWDRAGRLSMGPRNGASI